MKETRKLTMELNALVSTYEYAPTSCVRRQPSSKLINFVSFSLSLFFSFSFSLKSTKSQEKISNLRKKGDFISTNSWTQQAQLEFLACDVLFLFQIEIIQDIQSATWFKYLVSTFSSHFRNYFGCLLKIK